MKTKGSEPMSWFDDIFGQSKSNQNNEKEKKEQISSDYHPEEDSTNEEIYRRPKGKFRFPIQMEYEEQSDDNLEQYNQSENEPDNKPKVHNHDNRFYDENEASFPTNRRRRRRNQNSTQQSFNNASRTQNKDVNNYKNEKNNKTSNQNKKAEKYNEDTKFQERLNSLHQPKFKASEVPSAIFGMRKQKDVPNSGLKDHSTSDYLNDLKNIDTDNTKNENIQKDQNGEIIQDVPTYSKTDNTINIENIYASQIVSEIRKEREKKLQKKKQFEKALREKREQELKNLESEEEKSQVKNQDYFFKQQASYIKNNPNDNSNNEDVDKDNTSELNQSESTDDEIKMSLQPDVNDLTTYEFKEIDLDFDEESYNSDEQDIGQDMSEPYEDEHVHDQVFENEENATFEEVVEVEESDVSEQSHHEMSEQSSEDEQFEEQIDQEHEVINQVEENDTEALNNHKEEGHSEIIEESNHFVEDDISFEDFDVVEDSEPSSEEAFGLVDETLLESPQDEEAQNTQDIDDQHESNVQFEEVEKSEEKQTYEPVLKPNPTRKSSPFNVLMTPSDKRKHQTFKNDIKRKENNESNSQVVQENKENNESEQATKRKGPLFVLPPVSILDDVVEKEDNSEWLEDKKKELDEAFYHFNVPAHVVNMIQGPTVTRFELSVEKGVKVSRITALQDDIKMALAAKDIRIEAPIPGTSLVGIEVPNQSPKKIPLGQMITSKAFQQAESKLTVAMGFKINNEPLLMDISKTPHALIAGATGSGKSVCINAILTSLLYKNHPDELKLLLIDPKMVELAPYNNLPHLVAPVITDVKAATASLKWAVEEMERRYKRFAELHVRNITAFNKKANYEQRMAKIIIVIDELADLMMMSPQEVEQSIARIAQKARACGIHMILATQRPSVNVITGLIKANVPTRISFMVSSSIDSRTILDVGGAEKLLGNGDMLYLGNGMNKPIRVQGAFVSDDEIDETVSNVSNQMKPNYLFKEETLLKKVNEQPKDALFNDVCDFMVKEGHISTSLIQRHFQIGYNRAARMIDNLEERGFISGPNGSKPRDVLITKDMLEEKETNN